MNLDGENSPLDVLLVVNFLNTRPSDQRPIGDGESLDLRLDVSGDGWISPLDVLMLINHLNSRSDGAEGERSESPSMDLGDPGEEWLKWNDSDRAFADLGEWDSFHSSSRKRVRK